jgi:hypothetical protein
LELIRRDLQYSVRWFEYHRRVYSVCCFGVLVFAVMLVAYVGLKVPSAITSQVKVGLDLLAGLVVFLGLYAAIRAILTAKNAAMLNRCLLVLHSFEGAAPPAERIQLVVYRAKPRLIRVTSEHCYAESEQIR